MIKLQHRIYIRYIFGEEMVFDILFRVIFFFLEKLPSIKNEMSFIA